MKTDLWSLKEPTQWDIKFRLGRLTHVPISADSLKISTSFPSDHRGSFSTLVLFFFFSLTEEKMPKTIG